MFVVGNWVNNVYKQQLNLPLTKELRKAAFTVEYDIKFSEIVIDSHFLNLIFQVMIYHITFNYI